MSSAGGHAPRKGCSNSVFIEVKANDPDVGVVMPFGAWARMEGVPPVGKAGAVRLRGGRSHLSPEQAFLREVLDSDVLKPLQANAADHEPKATSFEGHVAGRKPDHR